MNARIDALTVPKAGNADATAARTALTPLVNAEVTTWRRATIRRWNTLISTTDTPGGSGRGYAAGAAVLAGHISRVRTYKDSKGWGATPSPSPSGSSGSTASPSPPPAAPTTTGSSTGP